MKKQKMKVYKYRDSNGYCCHRMNKKFGCCRKLKCNLEHCFYVDDCCIEDKLNLEDEDGIRQSR